MVDSANGDQLDRGSARVLPLNLHSQVGEAIDPDSLERAAQHVLLGHAVDGARFEQGSFLTGAFHLGARLSVVILGCFEISPRTGMNFSELFLAMKFMLGRDQVGLRLTKSAKA